MLCDYRALASYLTSDGYAFQVPHSSTDDWSLTFNSCFGGSPLVPGSLFQLLLWWFTFGSDDGSFSVPALVVHFLFLVQFAAAIGVARAPGFRTFSSSYLGGYCWLWLLAFQWLTFPAPALLGPSVFHTWLLIPFPALLGPSVFHTWLLILFPVHCNYQHSFC